VNLETASAAARRGRAFFEEHEAVPNER